MQTDDVKDDFGLRDLFYLDSEGLESLLAQTGEAVPHSVSRGSSIKSGGSFRSVLGGELSGSRSKRVELRFRGEHHLQGVLDYLSEHGLLDTNLERAVAHLDESSTRFVIAGADFDAPQMFDPGSDSYGAIISAGAIVFETQPGGYDPRDSYYRSRRVELVASASKMTGGSLAISGHLMAMLRAYCGRGIPLRFFGNLRKIGTYVHVKPYAVTLGRG